MEIFKKLSFIQLLEISIALDTFLANELSESVIVNNTAKSMIIEVTDMMKKKATKEQKAIPPFRLACYDAAVFKRDIKDKTLGDKDKVFKCVLKSLNNINFPTLRLRLLIC